MPKADRRSCRVRSPHGQAAGLRQSGAVPKIRLCTSGRGCKPHLATISVPAKKGISISEATILCPKCQGEIVQGYMRDFTFLGVRVSEWNARPPKKFFVGSIMDSTLQIPIVTFRCQSCGFLEWYARKEIP